MTETVASYERPDVYANPKQSIMKATTIKYSATLGNGTSFPIEQCTKKRKYHAMDTTIVVITAAAAAAAAAQLVTPEATALRVLILIPLIGALVIMGGAVMLNPDIETRKVTIGRGFFGVLFGAAGPYAMSALLQYWNLDGLGKLWIHPGMLLFEGASLAFIAFWMSKPFTRRFYEASDAMARHEVERIRRYQGSDEDAPTERLEP